MSSFTTRIKDEVTKIETNKLESISELLSYLKFSGNFIDDKITIYIENASVARRMYSLLKRIYGINIQLTIRTQKKFSVKTLYILEFNEKVDLITSDVNDLFKNIIDYSDEERSSYLKGAFLSSGSINDPNKSKYHLEFFADTLEEAKLINNLLLSFDFNSKVIKRAKEYMIYIKASEEISDFIKLIGAINALFYYEDIRIYRDNKNMVNRLNNCEQANVDKSVKASNDQLEMISKLRNITDFDLLDEKLKEVCIYREKYPDVSLEELAEIISSEVEKPITKSGINHRFRKIKKMLERINI